MRKISQNVSIDEVQKHLANNVFSSRKDPKKAAGRALGTLVEIVAYYVLQSWGLADHIVIENQVPEFGNPNITHNVEYSLHPILQKEKVEFKLNSPPLTVKKLAEHWVFPENILQKKPILISGNSGNYVLRNAARLAESNDKLIIANINNFYRKNCSINICHLSKNPFAIVECKRVGVEEGQSKGPQTIEKAKQGSYVANSVSSLQKIIMKDGKYKGIFEDRYGNLINLPYQEFQEEIICNPSKYPGFILTIGIVSNHGNWFTAENKNKELSILANSYDWLLFLTDDGLREFTNELILNPKIEMRPVKKAFNNSYKKIGGNNIFTKVKIDLKADKIIKNYFSSNSDQIEEWFNVITPEEGTIQSLRGIINKLAKREN